MTTAVILLLLALVLFGLTRINQHRDGRIQKEVSKTGTNYRKILNYRIVSKQMSIDTFIENEEQAQHVIEQLGTHGHRMKKVEAGNAFTDESWPIVTEETLLHFLETL